MIPEPMQKKTLETAGKELNGNPCPKVPTKYNQRVNGVLSL